MPTSIHLVDTHPPFIKSYWSVLGFQLTDDGSTDGITFFVFFCF